jgi:hypothetical protein
MVDPFMADFVDIAQRAEGAQPLDALGAAIDQRALFAGKRRFLVVAFKEILPDFGPKMLKDEPKPCRDRIVL